ncbi:MAG: DUF4145 domain-containing protein [Sarcina sp.]
MNKEKLLKLIGDMKEVVGNLKACEKVLKENTEDNKTIFIEFGLKQIFVDFFITVESLVSMLLKEHNLYKIGIDMKKALKRLSADNVIDKELYDFLDYARLLRNRISHRYKEPSREELLEFISENINKFEEVIKLAEKYY